MRPWRRWRPTGTVPHGSPPHGGGRGGAPFPSGLAGPAGAGPVDAAVHRESAGQGRERGGEQPGKPRLRRRSPRHRLSRGTHQVREACKFTQALRTPEGIDVETALRCTLAGRERIRTEDTFRNFVPDQDNRAAGALMRVASAGTAAFLVRTKDGTPLSGQRVEQGTVEVPDKGVRIALDTRGTVEVSVEDQAAAPAAPAKAALEKAAPPVAAAPAAPGPARAPAPAAAPTPVPAPAPAAPPAPGPTKQAATPAPPQAASVGRPRLGPCPCRRRALPGSRPSPYRRRWKHTRWRPRLVDRPRRPLGVQRRHEPRHRQDPGSQECLQFFRRCLGRRRFTALNHRLPGVIS